MARSDTCGTHHHKRTTTPKVVEPLPTPFPTPIRPLQGRSLLSPYSRRWRIPRHTAVNGCWTASPSIFIRACHPDALRFVIVPLSLPSRDMDARKRTYPRPRSDIWTLMQEQYINVGCLFRAVFQAFAGRVLMSDIGNSITDIEKTTSDLENSMSDIGNGLYLHFHIGKQDGETVPQEITAVWREMRHLRQSTPKDDDPEGGRTVPNPVPDSCSTSSRSFPLSPHPRRWRIPRHTAVSVCWTASPSVCIRVCPLSICIYLSYTGRTLRSAATTCWGRGEKINPVRIGGGRG